MSKEKEKLGKLSPDDIKEKFYTSQEKELTKTQEIKISVKNSKLMKFMTNPNEAKKKKDYTILPHNIERFNPEVTKGLSYGQVEQRNAEGLTNNAKDTTTRSYREIFVKNIFNFLNIITFSIAIAMLVFENYTQALFVWVAVVNTVISLVQEIKAKKIVEKLKLVTAQNVRVLRDGKIEVLSSKFLVLDDVYVLNNGDQIPTDSVIMSGEVEVNESLLTGESLPIKKKEGQTIYAGSFIISGSIIVKAVSIGNYNYAFGIQSKAKEFKKIQSELVSSLNKLIKTIAFIIVPLGITLFFIQFYFSDDITKLPDAYDRARESFSYTAGSLVGMIPTGMYLLTSVALSTGVISLSSKKTLVQDIYCIEMLSRTTTLCLDKTGTLTDGTMTCSEVFQCKQGYDLEKLVGSYLGAFDESNQTSIALLKKYPLRNDYIIESKIPFSSERKYSLVSFKEEGTFILGAPEYVHRFGKTKASEQIQEFIYEKQSKGFRVVMLAQCDKDITNDKIVSTPIAVFVIQDQIREDARGTIEWFVKNGVKIKIISGDNPLTASEIARKCGVPNADKAVSLEGVSAEEVIPLIKEYTVLGRVSPEQKAIIVKELKRRGETVAMTGDGVNDILAMKNADCSIAMANGSSSAKNVAHLVLLDSNFSHMPEVVAEGRRVINNIQRSSSLFLMKTIFSIVFTIIVLFTYIPGGARIAYPLKTYNIFIMEVAGIGLPSVLLALQKNNAEIRGHFIRNTLSRAIPGSICMILVVSLAYVFRSFNLLGLGIDNLAKLPIVQGISQSNLQYVPDASFTTFCAFGVTLVSLCMVFNCCLPFNKYRLIVYGLSLLVASIMAFVFPFIEPIFGNATFELSPGIVSNFSTQFMGIDFRYLTWQEALYLILFFLMSNVIMTGLIVLFSFMRGEKMQKVTFFDFDLRRRKLVKEVEVVEIGTNQDSNNNEDKITEEKKEDKKKK